MNAETSSPFSSPPAAEESSPPQTKGARRPRKRWFAVLAALVAAGAVTAVFLMRQQAPSAAQPVLNADAPTVTGDLIRYSRAFAERAGIRVTEVTRARMVPVVTAVGTVDFNPEHVAAVGTRLRGLVSRVTKFEGDTVEAGTLLALIESPELGEAQAAVSMLEAEKQAADVNLQREVSLSEKRLSTAREAEVARVDAQKYQLLLGAARQKVAALSGGAGQRGAARLGAHELRSPIKGTIVERSIAPGQTVEGELVAFRVANMDHMWVELEVFERSLERIRVGDRVELSPLSAPHHVLDGRVARVGAQIDPNTRSAPLRIEIDNRDRRLRAGQAVNAKIHASVAGEQDSTLVPSTAITFIDGKATVFVQSSEGAVRVAKVEPGLSNGRETQVLSGVNPGERVVSDGVFALKSELFR